jgi:type VI secretion system protein VasD
VLVLPTFCGCKMLGFSPTVAKIDLQAEKTLNPDDTGRPSPIRVRLYELKSATAFNSADFFSLYDRDKEVLAADLVMREELQVEPGMEKEMSKRPGPDTKFLAVLAAYHDIEHATWRATLELPPNKTTNVSLRVDRLVVSLASVKKGWFWSSPPPGPAKPATSAPPASSPTTVAPH